MIMKANKTTAKPVVKKKTGFVYKARDAKSVRARAEQTGGKYDSIFKSGMDTYTAKAGDNCIRFLPPTWDGHDHYGLDIWVHSYVGVNKGSYLCLQKMLSKRCPICEAALECSEAGEADDAKKLEPSRRVLAWIIDREGDSKTPQLYSMSWSMDKDISTLADNKRSGEVLLIDHPDEGFDVSFKRTGQKLNTRYVGVAIDRSPSPISDRQKTQDAILAHIEENPLPNVLEYKSADFLEKIIAGTAEEKDEDLDEEEDTDEENAPKKKKKKPVSKKARDEAEDEDDEEPPFDADEEGGEDEDDETEEDEDDDGPPKKSSSKSKAKPKPPVKPKRKAADEEEEEDNEEEDDEPDEEEEEKPAKSKSKRKPARNEEEDEDDEEEDDGEESEEDPEDEDDGEEEPDEDNDGEEDEEEEDAPRRSVKRVKPATKKGRR